MKSIIFILTLTLVLLVTNSSGTRLLHSAQTQMAQPQTEAQKTIDEEKPIINNICNDQAAEKGSNIESTFISGKTIIHFYGII